MKGDSSTRKHPTHARCSAARDSTDRGQRTPVTVTSEEPNSIKGDYHINFAKLDRNHDGYISRDEAKADPTLEREFAAVDTKHAGRLSKAQLEGWMQKK